MKKIHKAVIPAAGFGTRFLPATKSMPKEMLPIIDKPMIHYCVEEAVKAGITDIIFISGRGKRALEDYFDHSYELEDQLRKTGKDKLLKEIECISDMANIIYVRQKEPLGLGHAVLRAKSIIGDEPFALLLPDMIDDNEKSYTEQVLEVYEKTGKTVIGLKETTPEKISAYGVADPDGDGEIFKLKNVIEKPSPEEAPSNLYIYGRYIMTPRVFEFIEKSKPGKNGEIQFTDAIREIIKTEGAYGVKLKGIDFDTGNKLGYLQAMTWYGLKHENLNVEYREYLESLLKEDK